MNFSSETPPWPSKRQKLGGKENIPTPSPISLSTPFPPTNTPISRSISLNTPPRTPLADKKHRTQYRNGYEVKPQTPSFKPYTLNNRGHPRQKAFVFEGFRHILPQGPLSTSDWNSLARESGVLKDGQSLKDFQVEVANIVISRKTDLCVVAPTGSGKSHLWVLPLLTQKKGSISLVIIPFTSLGYQGEERCGFC